MLLGFLRALLNASPSNAEWNKRNGMGNHLLGGGSRTWPYDRC